MNILSKFSVFSRKIKVSCELMFHLFLCDEWLKLKKLHGTIKINGKGNLGLSSHKFNFKLCEQVYVVFAFNLRDYLYDFSLECWKQFYKCK